MNSRITSPPPVTPLGLNLAPLVDVMMCLLIFFLLATRLTERESVRIDLPVAASARETPHRDMGRRIVVNVISDTADAAEYIVNGRSVALSELEAVLRREAQDRPTIICYVRAARDVSYGRVEPILTRCAAAGIANVTFATALEGGGR